MTIHFNAKEREYEANKPILDKLLLQSMIQEPQKCHSVATLEKTLATYVGTDESIICNTQYNAFILLFMILDLKSGDEVITSPLGSGIAVQAALFMGAKVVFVDVNEADYTLDVEQVEDAITERTKLIIPVSTLGNCADMQHINTLATQHDLCVIEDAAESFGATQDGKKSTQLSRLATTSFFPTMPLHGFGNGAALFIADGALREKARLLRSQGRLEGYYEAVGIEACMDQTQAAVVNFRVGIFDEEMRLREKVAKSYNKALLNSGYTLPHFTEGSNYAYYALRAKDRDKILQQLQKAGVEYKLPFTTPLHLHKAFAFMQYHEGDFPYAESLAQQLLLLPLHAYLTEEEQQSVIAALL